MSTPMRAVAFVAGLAAFFALAFGVGRAVGPLDTTAAAHDDMGAAGHDDEAGGHGDMDMPAVPAVGGLQTSQDGYTLALEDTRLAAGAQTVAFTVTGPDGHPLASYDEQHEKDLHLIVVGRDLQGFQDVHPVLDAATGLWSAEVDLTPGAWRVIADFDPTGGDPLVLGSDLLVAGDAEPTGLGPDSRSATVDGYDVTLDGDLVPGEESALTLTLRKDDRPVTDLSPYLGAYGHLVALRAGDLAYLHVHPDGGPGEVPPGPEIVFHAEVPSIGSYRLFLDFRHDGIVRTAAFTVRVEEAGHEH